VDWQVIAVIAIVACACAYVGRMVFLRLRALAVRRSADANCDAGCGNCSSGSADPAPSNLVSITRKSGNRV
jgi:hypothetical protein